MSLSDLIELTVDQYYWLMPEYCPVVVPVISDAEAEKDAARQRKAMENLAERGIVNPTVEQVLDSIED